MAISDDPLCENGVNQRFTTPKFVQDRYENPVDCVVKYMNGLVQK